MEKNSPIFITGHKGLVGSAIRRVLESRGFSNLLLVDRKELDLLDQREVLAFLEEKRPHYIFLAAALVGGIQANALYPASFIYENLQIQNNLIHGAYLHGVKKLLFLGSSCIYPRVSPQPIKEEYLLTGPLEPTNEPYAIAKIAGIKMCQSYNRQYGKNFISLMPTNLYGPEDNFNLQSSHVLPALIRKFHEALQRGEPKITLWGTGKARREFLFVDDLAEAAVFLMEGYSSDEIINVGAGKDISILELANLMKDVFDFKGEILFDSSKPDGMEKKLIDSSKIFSLGWKPKTSLKKGIEITARWFQDNQKRLRG